MRFQFNAAKSHPYTQDDKIIILSMHLNVSKLINCTHLLINISTENKFFDKIQIGIDKNIKIILKYVKL